MRWRRWLAGIAGLLAVGAMDLAPVRAAGSYDMAKDQAAAARQAMAQGQWDEAQARLARAIERCEPAVDGRPCRLLLHYSFGYLYARWADAVPERRDGLLARSADFYRRVLAEAPAHAETINNLALVLRDQGKLDELQGLRDRMQARDPVLAARIVTVIGDSHAARGDWNAAYQAYADAVALDPGAESARQKLLEAFRQADSDDTAALLGRLHRWEARFPDLAADGYRTVVQTGVARAGTLNERALLRWISLTAAQRAISSTFVERQFGGLNQPTIDAFIAFLKTVETLPRARAPNLINALKDRSGTRCIGTKGWWLETPHRRNALAEVALALGRAAVVAQDVERAESSFVIGVLCGPPSEEYMFGSLRDETFVLLDIMTELAWLQFRYPARDPDHKKLDAVVHVLFEGKGGAYQANDLRAIERHHVVLGQIYAEMGVWSGGGARNAIFQLSRAVRTAEQRARAGDAYDPMPGLKTLLGEGYERTGDQDKAQATYISAAQAYLDSDDLTRTEAVLARAKAVAPAPPASEGTNARLQAIEATEKILAVRRDLLVRQPQSEVPPSPPAIEIERDKLPEAGTRPPARVHPDAATRITPSTRAPVDAAPPASGLPEEGLEGLSTEFLRRQQFKVNADLATLARRQNDEAASARYAGEAIKAAREIKTLIGVDDVRRLEQAGALTTPEADGARPRVDLSYGAETEAEPGTETSNWRVRLPSTGEPLKAQLKE